MKRLGLFLYGTVFSVACAHALGPGSNPLAAAGALGTVGALVDSAPARTNGSMPVPQDAAAFLNHAAGTPSENSAWRRFATPASAVSSPYDPKRDELRATPESSAGSNGIVHSGPLNRAMPATWLGMSYNIVTGTFSNAGTFSAEWDFNFALGFNAQSAHMFVLTFNAIADNEGAYVVDAGGHVRVLQDGDVVGPDTRFSTASTVPLDPAWLDGIDGVVGVRFKCDDRLMHPVAGGLCYGYIRIATTNVIGLPARIIDAAFDGDGQPITVATPVAVNPPAATLTPNALSFSVAANTTRAQSVQIANAVGSQPLRYAIGAQGEGVALTPRAAEMAKAGRSAPMHAASPLLPVREWASPQPVVSRALARGRALGAWGSPGNFPYLIDDGSFEELTSLGVAAVWMNRFTVVEPQTINSVSVLWASDYEGGSPIGLQANLVAYYDASGSGDPRNAQRLGDDHLVTIAELGTFQTYKTSFEVPGAGDIYVGFAEHWAMNGYPFDLYVVAIDTDTLSGKSYVSANEFGGGPPDIDVLANNAFNGSLGSLYLNNLMIRATGTNGACSGAAVPWLTATTAGNGNTVVGGASTEVIVTADPAAAGLTPGAYTAELCITSNDPDRRVIAVPISLEVTTGLVAHTCSSIGDGIFCEGFDGVATDDIVRSGILNMALPRSEEGMSFNFGRGEWSPDAFRGDDFSAYSSQVLLFYWYGDLVPETNGGVAESALGPYRVLRSGDTIGPDSIFSEMADGTNGETAHFIAGVDGYLGFKFYNEETRQTNYGYMHVITTWPNGFPATLVEYAYNKSGGPITIP